MTVLEASLTLVSLCLVFAPVALSGTDTWLYTDDWKMVFQSLDNKGALLDCQVYGDSSDVQGLLSGIPDEDKFLVTKKEFISKAEGCHDFLLQDTRVSSSKRISKRSVLEGIYPGTKWCGKGNIAVADDSLGTLVKEDTCCRTHDQCLPKIHSKETKYGITNTGKYTAFHCDCDRAFYDCMKAADTFHSFVIGTTYFDALGSQCFELDYPEVCTTYLWFFENCERDSSQPKVLQFKGFPKSYTV